MAVSIKNSDGQVSNSLAYTYKAGPLAPSVSMVSPASGSSHGGLTVSIAGSNFSPSPAPPRVRFGDQVAEVLSASETLIVATLPANAPGVVAVAVTNPDAQAGTLPSAFTCLASPDSGSTTGGEQVELAGTFDSTTPPKVTFGGTPAIAAGHSSTTITVLAPAHGEGVVDVTLTNGDGQVSTLADAFSLRYPLIQMSPKISRVAAC